MVNRPSRQTQQPSPPLGPGVHLHLGCDALTQGDAKLPQLGGQLCQQGVQFLFFHKVLLSNLLGR